jgi:hypothetical protein
MFEPLQARPYRIEPAILIIGVDVRPLADDLANHKVSI